MSILQDRLDQAIEKAINERGAGWERKRKPRNGRLLPWRVPHAVDDGVEVCIWPDASGYVITDTSPDRKTYIRQANVDTAIRMAEELAGVLQPQ